MQERAALTRAGILQAAATLFDRNGYDGTSYSQITKSAGVSLGSLTFHFASKAQLAEAVQAQGLAVAQSALKVITDRDGSAMEQVLETTLELTGLLQEDVRVRAALRLERERRGSGLWADMWLPAVHALIRRAHATGELRDSVEPEDVSALVELLITGADNYLRERCQADVLCAGVADRLRRLWHLVMDGLCVQQLGLAEDRDCRAGCLRAAPQPASKP
ncbi:TetR/AcrR family transcriptional regulator [Streptomyces sp. G44]|uniref:TetR/AcrR family transcriptional regulator n=1 Tax=Streptomyces sp. G44 TaxID=2807632 RepID=UPI00195F8C95|nr:TetR/AcrR family transcriptional regulator [Streptomyces sp. G44]MBM7167691.1 TetR/AcrR family transcriptional regulator [Streptomyces sp. G44]